MWRHKLKAQAVTEKKDKEKPTTLPYSHRNPERGIAKSCNGHCITLSMNAFTFVGCITNIKYQATDQRIEGDD